LGHSRTLRIVSCTAALLILGIWLASLGIPVLTILAGFGIGGIAVALAAQRTIENFFGAFMLFADHPVGVGDFCIFGENRGTVESIGLRSTRIRTLERTLITVPNAEFSRLQLENLAFRDRILFNATLNLLLGTTNEQLQRVLSSIRDLLRSHNAVHEDDARVRLVALGPLSLDLEIFAYIKTNDGNDFLVAREELFLHIMRVVEEAGTALAPPAQMTYVRTAERPQPHDELTEHTSDDNAEVDNSSEDL
jgi:MscS family membrane protein